MAHEDIEQTHTTQRDFEREPSYHSLFSDAIAECQQCLLATQKNAVLIQIYTVLTVYLLLTYQTFFEPHGFIGPVNF